MYYTYILRNSSTGRYYVGYTSDLKNRLAEHKLGRVKSTKSDLRYELEWYCTFREKDQAISLEKYLKSGSGIAFMKKRFFSHRVALVKDDSSME
jgi:predicted GIY-YIG superfamily endonuclease